MNSIQEMILKKRDGAVLNREEWSSFTHDLIRNEIPDYQTSALLMACFLNGLNHSETVELTHAMAFSGKAYQWKSLKGPIIDKHSTGGVGDKVSLILAPLAAACGIYVPMMSGRSLGFTGGTLDKLESIPGYQTQLSDDKIQRILKRVGCVIIGQSEEIAPADRILYSLRDVTGTVESIPLIVSSILSKKFAEGTKGLIIDLKSGSGALMKNTRDGKKLAHELITVAKLLGINATALLTQMNQPLGVAIGNRIEVLESIQILSGISLLDSTSDPDDTRKLTIELTAEMILLGKIETSRSKARKLAQSKLENGEAWERFKQMCQEQGVAASYLSSPHKLRISKNKIPVFASEAGFIERIDCEFFGRLLIELGGGRRKKTDRINPRVGIQLHKKVGDAVKRGENLLDIYYENDPGQSELKRRIRKAIKIGKKKLKLPLVYGRTAS